MDFIDKIKTNIDGSIVKNSSAYFLEAATGGGKTLTMLLPTLVFDTSIMIAYPTNALIEDQRRSITDELKKMSLSDNINVQMIYSKMLYDYADENDLANAGDALYQFLLETAKETTIYLTNPDTIYNAYFERFGEVTREGIKGMISTRLIPFLAFDEFHLYDIKEQSAVYSILTYHKAIQRDRIFLFSSATPDEEFYEFIKKLEDPIFKVNKISDDRDSKGNRIILQPVELEMQHSEEWKSFDKIKSKSNEIVDRLKDGEDVAVIMDSAAQADRFYLHISQVLEDEFGKDFISKHCSLTTGLRGKHTSLEPNDPDVRLAVGTQPLSVGINFDVDHIIFESRRAPDFLQKLGRVGRGKGASGLKKATATSYIPGTAIDKIEKKVGGSKIQRYELEKFAESYFPGKRHIFEYMNKYAPFEFLKLFRWDEYTDEAFDWNKYYDAYYKAFNISIDDARKRLDEYQIYFGNDIELFENALYSFRGESGPVVAVMIECLDGIDTGVYDVYHILRHYDHKDAEVMDKEDFKSACEDSQLNKQLEKGLIEPLAYVKLDASDRMAKTTQYETKVYHLDDSMDRIDTISEISILPEKGMRTPLVGAINDSIGERKFLARVCTPNDFNKIGYKLPYLFKSIKIKNMLNKELIAAFGTNALYLDSLLNKKDGR